MEYHGIRNLEDAARYVFKADDLIKYGTLTDLDYVFYSVPIGLIALFRWLIPGTIVPYLIFQCIVSALAALALYRSATKVFSSNAAGFFSSLIFILWLDNIHWNITTMTESLARSFICFIIYGIVHWQDRRRDYILMTALMLLIFFIRPTGVITILSVVVFLLSYYWVSLKEKRLLLLLFLSLILALSIFWTDKMFSHWDFTDQYIRGNIVTYADLVKVEGLKSEYLRIDPPLSKSFIKQEPSLKKVLWFIYENPFHFLKAASMKVFYLISFVRPYYSPWHNIYSLSWVILISVLCFLGWRLTANVPLRLFVLTAIFANCLLVGISTVDWDNRFYIPMEPGIILLAGGGVAYLNNRIGLENWVRNLLSR